MQPTARPTARVDRTAKTKIIWNGVERRRVEQVVETLATLGGRGETLSEVAHDARNMVTALGLYCDLLEEPGVLATAFTHYAHELRLVAAASRRLVEKLVALDTNLNTNLDANGAPRSAFENLTRLNAGRVTAISGTEVDRVEVASFDAANFDGARADALHGARARAFAGSLPSPVLNAATLQNRNPRWDLLPALPVSNLAAELMANRNLLAALAGPSIALTVGASGGAQAVRLSGEDLTRLLVNLVKNAAEAMPQAPTPTPTPTQNTTQSCRIYIALREAETAPGAEPSLALTVEDTGPGIPEAAFETIFTSGYTSRGREASAGAWPQSHRGLGLAIVRSIVEGAGGRITASNRAQGGACFTLELPVWKTGIGNRD